MTERKPVSKTVRFEVFKRDRFTCQYCGAKAPEVVLHCDHIDPVANGGTNDIMNLITACAACNGGKGAKLLDDRSAVEKQRAQIEELENRREQLEMLLAWRDAAQAERVDAIEAIATRIGERGGFEPNENGKADIRKWLLRFSVSEVLEALDISFDQYMTFTGDKPDDGAWNRAFSKIPGVAAMRRVEAEKPYLSRLFYIQGILRNRTGYRRMGYVDALEDYHKDGVPVDALESAAKKATTWDQFCDLMDAWHEAND